MYNEMTLDTFLNKTASKDAVPGGGSVAALTGALAAALSAMVANLTVGKEKYISVSEQMESIIERMNNEKDLFLALIDEDSQAFDHVINAMKMPKTTDEEKKVRTEKLQTSLKIATEAPYKIADQAAKLFDEIEFLVVNGNAHAQTDALVAALLTRTAILSALYNVKINLMTIKDESYVNMMTEKVKSLENLAIKREAEILQKTDF